VLRYSEVEKCLAKISLKAVALEAGGKWEKIETIITRQLSEKDITVYVYDRA
jgi:hypothetical protein